MPLSRRLPKLKGFTRAYFKTTAPTATLTLSALNVFDNGAVVDIKTLKEKKLIKGTVVQVKVVSKGSLDKKLEFNNLLFSKTAKELVLKAGCTIK
jgi:large subunit ribosomal protein L15